MGQRVKIHIKRSQRIRKVNDGKKRKVRRKKPR